VPELFCSWDLAYRCTKGGWLKPIVQGKRRTIYRLADVLTCLRRIEAGELPLPRRNKAAKAFVAQSEQPRHLLGCEAFILPMGLRAEALACSQRLKPLNAMLTPAVEFFIRNVPRPESAKSIEELKEEFLKSRKAMTCRSRTIVQYESYLRIYRVRKDRCYQTPSAGHRGLVGGVLMVAAYAQELPRDPHHDPELCGGEGVSRGQPGRHHRPAHS
jgi:hypothetical protein